MYIFRVINFIFYFLLYNIQKFYFQVWNKIISHSIVLFNKNGLFNKMVCVSENKRDNLTLIENGSDENERHRRQ